MFCNPSKVEVTTSIFSKTRGSRDLQTAMVKLTTECQRPARQTTVTNYYRRSSADVKQRDTRFTIKAFSSNGLIIIVRSREAKKHHIESHLHFASQSPNIATLGGVDQTNLCQFQSSMT